ncbi:nucleoside triphosphate pyrophosphatase [Croceicoccus sp. BE223]|uniref:Maf family protein n=1 Tax=Croceicoccus sp. BE223 TaxID=2817716 RepID=UPI002866ED87|nr:nucleoside triphosphate pyrophosphatase [Croceicoccus sp. BE223]MDR7102200.1 septum formation protein [Croceicoccus sp. BE223]
MLILASKSASRQAMLSAAGVAFTAVPADIDERALEAALPDAAPADIAAQLAEAKARTVSAQDPGALVLGSDSLVVVDGRRFDKPADREEAGAHLRQFSGRTMELYSGAVLVRDGLTVARIVDCARLSVRELSDRFIETYLDAEWPEVGHCVGVFRIEARGPQLFSAIEGDQFTVLGMPLLAVLAALRDEGVLPA